MRISTKISKNLPALIGLLTLLLSSCAKVQPDYNTGASAISGISFFQASPDEPSVALFFGASRINQTPIAYGQSITNFSVDAGKYPVNIYNANTLKIILSDTINFAANTVYSMFLANKPSQPEIVLLTDTIGKPTAGNATVRFVNLSPDAAAVDLVVKGGATLVANKAYKGYSSFVPITGNTVYTIEVHQAGTNTVLATLANYKLNTGFVYTIYFHGLAAGTSSSDQLSVDIFNNAYFL